MTTTTRREFLRAAAATGLVGGAAPIALGAGVRGRSTKGLKILILGGTGFLGPETVQEALDRGHEMTLFNRGKTRPELFADLPQLRGDRNQRDLESLKGGQWDAVVDTSGYVPQHVTDSAGLLADAVKHYVFISTVSVYASSQEPGADEDDAVGEIDAETEAGITEIRQVGPYYGPLKARCEQEAEKSMPGRVCVIRPGLIVGPGDPTDRFTYWPVRVSRGGRVLCPGDGKTPEQHIDVRDLARWIITCIEQRVTGIYNAVSEPGATRIGDIIDTSRRVSGSDAEPVWVDAAFLEAQNVSAWQEMPCWVPPEGEYAGFGLRSVARAIAKGLTIRPLGETVRGTLDWWNEQPEARRARLRAGIAAEKEAQVLDAWDKRDG